MRSSIRQIISLMILLVAMPMSGIYLAGKPVAQYMEFPPCSRYVVHADFSWLVFVLMSVLIAICVIPFILRVVRCRSTVEKMPHSVRSFPWWGWLGVILTAGAWIVAWNRFEFFGSCQRFTFTPLWLGYIVVINALTYRRSGKCMLIDRPLYFMGLFCVSAAFWWYFEYLNRFVQNWYYTATAGLSKTKYFIFATLPFSTVLPAVLGTYELLRTMPSLSAGLDNFFRIGVKLPKLFSAVVLLVFTLSLAAIGVWPNYLYPILWISPLGVISAIKGARGENTIFSDVSEGRWSKIWLLVLSALICGFFWELWNFKSMAKWIYSVPFVGRFKIFEMPLLGYAGYLPFGLECAVVADLFMNIRFGRQTGSPAEVA